MVILYGGRSSELVGLPLADIHESEQIPFFRIDYTDLRPLKNVQSIRHLPIHPELIRLGFLDYIAAMRSAGHELLFPEMHYLDAQVTRDTEVDIGNRLRGVPRLSASLWTTYRFEAGPLSGLMLGAGATRAGKRAGDLANSYWVPGYTRFGLTAGYRIADRYKVGVIVRNLTDRFYIE